MSFRIPSIGIADQEEGEQPEAVVPDAVIELIAERVAWTRKRGTQEIAFSTAI